MQYDFHFGKDEETNVQSWCSMAVTVSGARRTRGMSEGTADHTAELEGPPAPHAHPFSVIHSDSTFSIRLQSRCNTRTLLMANLSPNFILLNVTND